MEIIEVLLQVFGQQQDDRVLCGMDGLVTSCQIRPSDDEYVRINHEQDYVEYVPVNF